MRGWSGPAGAVVPALPAAIPATCVPWNDARGSTARRPGSPEPGPGNARATITFGVVHRVPPFGKPGGIGVAGRVEEHVRLVDPVVDDADLDPLAARAAAGGRPEGVGLDQLRAVVEREPVADARVDLGREALADECGELRRGQVDGEAVEDDPEAAVHARIRDRAAELRHRSLLRAREAGEVRARRGARDVELARTASGLQRASRPLRERGLSQADDHGDPAARVSLGDDDRPGADARELDLAGAPVDRAEVGRSGDGDDERRDDEERNSQAAQGRQQ